MAAHLLILGQRDALMWVLENQRMAFPEHRRSLAQRLRVGDELFLYVTRGGLGNPNRDRGRVFGLANVKTPVGQLEPPVVISGRTFRWGCALSLRGLAKAGAGVELAPLIPALEAFPHNTKWAVRLRTALLRLPEADVALLRSRLDSLLGTPDQAIPGYLAVAKRRRPRRTASAWR